MWAQFLPVFPPTLTFRESALTTLAWFRRSGRSCLPPSHTCPPITPAFPLISGTRSHVTPGEREEEELVSGFSLGAQN